MQSKKTELAYAVGYESHFYIQETEGGYDYSLYNRYFELVDGGVLENEDIDIDTAAASILADFLEEGYDTDVDVDQVPEDPEWLMKQVEDNE